MRTILSKQEEAKNKKVKQFVIGGILILVMVLSTVGFALQGTEEENDNKLNGGMNYNGFEFINQGNLWAIDVGDVQFVFQNNPLQTESLLLEENIELNYLNSYSGKPLYISSEDEGAELEIYRNFDPRRGNEVIQRIQSACIQKEDCGESLPLKTCEDNFIIIEESESMEIIQEENCVFIRGKQENLTQITDEFLFRILGIK